MKCVERIDARFLLFIYGLWNDALVPLTVGGRMGGQLVNDELEETWAVERLSLSRNLYVVRGEN